MQKKTIRKLSTILVLIVMGAIFSLAAHSKAMNNENRRVPVFSAENLRGTMKWWLYGAPFYLFLIFAPDKYFSDENEGGAED